MAQQKSFLEKLGSADYRIIYAIMTILVALPLVYPIGVPQSIAPPVINYVETINKLKPHDLVLVSFSGYMTMLPDVAPIYIATWKMLMTKQVRVMIFMSHVDSPTVIRQEFAQLGWDTVYTEGTDYVIWPYMTMTESAEIAWTADIVHGFFTTDIRGISVDSIPMLQSIHDAHDIALYICESPEYCTRRYVLAGTPNYNVKLLVWGTATNVQPFVPPFYDPVKGPVYGYAGGASQGAMMEAYLFQTTHDLKYAGEGVKSNDAKNLGVIGLVVIVIIGNISYFGTRGKKEEK